MVLVHSQLQFDTPFSVLYYREIQDYSRFMGNILYVCVQIHIHSCSSREHQNLVRRYISLHLSATYTKLYICFHIETVSRRDGIVKVLTWKIQRKYLISLIKNRKIHWVMYPLSKAIKGISTIFLLLNITEATTMILTSLSIKNL